VRRPNRRTLAPRAGDVQKLCAGVPAGGGRILACLKQHKDEVSEGCKQAMLSAMGRSSGDAGSAASPAHAAAPTPAAAGPAPVASTADIAGKSRQV